MTCENKEKKRIKTHNKKQNGFGKILPKMVLTLINILGIIYIYIHRGFEIKYEA